MLFLAWGTKASYDRFESVYQILYLYLNWFLSYLVKTKGEFFTFADAIFYWLNNIWTHKYLSDVLPKVFIEKSNQFHTCVPNNFEKQGHHKLFWWLIGLGWFRE